MTTAATVLDSIDSALEATPLLTPAAVAVRQARQYEPTAIPAVTGRPLPWAGLVTGSANDNETLTSGELLARAGLDWTTGIRPLWRKMNDGSYRQHPRARETYRENDETPLGEVKSHYEPFSNADMFAFGDTIVEAGEGRWTDAGMQGSGFRVFMCMLLKEFTVLGNDPYRLYLFLRGSHDGSTGLNAWVVPFRVSCTNQQQLVTAQHRGMVKIQHTANIAERVEEAKTSLREAAEYSEAFTTLAEKLAATAVSDQKVRAVLSRLLRENRSRRDDMIADIRHVYLTSTTVEPHRGTAYGLLNAITEYFDHVKRQNSDNARFESIMIGEGAKARTKALQALAGLN